MTVRSGHTRPRRRRLCAAALVVVGLLATVGCTSSKSDGASGADASLSSADSDPAVAAARPWTAVFASPCTLLTRDQAQKASGLKLVAKPTVSSAGRCRYVVADTPKTAPDGVTVDLLPPQTAASWKAHTAGTTSAGQPWLRNLALDAPGAGVVVRGPTSTAIVRVASTDARDDALAKKAVAVGKVVRPRLPTATGGRPLDGLADLCGIVPPATVGKDAVSGDPVSPAACSYRLPDGTRIQFRVTAPVDEDKVTLPDEAKCGDVDAHSSSVPSPPGGSSQLVAQIGGKTFEITASSPALPPDKLLELSKAVCAKFVKAA